MWEMRKNSQLAMGSRRYYLVILGISEPYLTQTKQKRLDLGEMLSGRTSADGVERMISHHNTK